MTHRVMPRFFVFGVAMLAYAAAAGAQQPSHTLTLTGLKAKRLISLLASASPAIQTSLREQGATSFKVRQLTVRHEATLKYDPSSPYFALDVYAAKAQVGDTAAVQPIGEGAALFSFLKSAGVRGDAAMDGTYESVDALTCTIDTKSKENSPQRYRCELSVSF